MRGQIDDAIIHHNTENSSVNCMKKIFSMIVLLRAIVAFGVLVARAAAFQGGPPAINDAPPGGITAPQPVLSPPAKSSVKFGAGRVTVAYSSP